MVFLTWVFFCSVEGDAGSFTLDSLRDALIRIEDTIVFGLIERARFPLNRSVYDKAIHGGVGRSLLEFVVRETEAIHAKVSFLSPFFSLFS